MSSDTERHLDVATQPNEETEITTSDSEEHEGEVEPMEGQIDGRDLGSTVARMSLSSPSSTMLQSMLQ